MINDVVTRASGQYFFESVHKINPMFHEPPQKKSAFYKEMKRVKPKKSHYRSYRHVYYLKNWRRDIKSLQIVKIFIYWQVFPLCKKYRTITVGKKEKTFNNPFWIKKRFNLRNVKTALD